MAVDISLFACRFLQNGEGLMKRDMKNASSHLI
jgi:hypothetical protein